jgi:membrane protein implicated in regulation of membrane protease activity
MDINKVFKSLTKIEIALLIVFVLYIVLPIQTPDFMAGWVDSSLGMLTIFAVTVFLFLNVSPVVAVVYILVGYELLRRSSKKTGRVTLMKYTPTQAKKDMEMKAMNPVQEKTLEEEIVGSMAPIGRSDPNVYVETTFKPVADKIKDGSLYE